MFSSLFPRLSSLLVSPLKTDVRTTVIQQMIQERDRDGFTSRDRQQVHLSFHDIGLRGIQGALIVLDALASNPFADQLTLSHNQLGDLGVRHLSEQIQSVSKRRTARVNELNLASNSLTNLALIDLCRYWDGLSELYLSNNRIDLQIIPSPLLNLANLTLLSLTSNPLDCQSISNLFRDVNFSPLELTTLHLSACNLDLNVATSLALWLEDKARSAKLEWLAVNGNNWGTSGCERITWALARKQGNCRVLRLEMLACDSPSSSSSSLSSSTTTTAHMEEVNPHLEEIKLMGFRDFEDLENCRTTIQENKNWKDLLHKCESRNQALKLATRRAALGLVSSARLILLSSPAPAPASGVSENDPKSSDNDNKNIFPWNKLPQEIQLHIWRWVSILSMFPKVSLLLPPIHPNQLTPPHFKSDLVDYFHSYFYSSHHDDDDGNGDHIPDPLTPFQLNKIIAYSRDRSTLKNVILTSNQFLFNHHSNKNNNNKDNCLEQINLNLNHNQHISLHRHLIQNQNIHSDLDLLIKSLILKNCHCQRFLGSI